MSAETLKDLSLEDTFAKMDEVFEKLQSDEVSLEQSFEIYKEGMELLEHARGVIDTVEKKVVMLSTGGDE